MDLSTINDFQKLEIHVGKIIEVNDFPKARKSEVLTLSVPSENNSVILIQPNKTIPLGGMLY